MPKLKTNQCVACGRIKVKGSTLCASCLAVLCDVYEQKLKTAACKIERLQQANETVNGILNEALAYGFKKNQENMRLHNRIKGLYGKIREVMEDSKNRVHENK